MNEVKKMSFLILFAALFFFMAGCGEDNTTNIIGDDVLVVDSLREESDSNDETDYQSSVSVSSQTATSEDVNQSSISVSSQTEISSTPTTESSSSVSSQATTSSSVSSQATTSSSVSSQATTSSSVSSQTTTSSSSVSSETVDPGDGEYTLSTNTNGEGTISVSPQKSLYEQGEQVQVTASASAGWTFVRWEGNAWGSDNPFTATIWHNSNITAIFEQSGGTTSSVSSSSSSQTTTSSSVSSSSSSQTTTSSSSSSSTPTGGRLDNITRSCSGVSVPGSPSGGQAWASRYWDCCKPHCGWSDNANPPSTTCDASGVNTIGADTQSGCSGGNSYTCYNQAPFAVCEDLSYGFAAVHAPGVQCGKCYLIEFDGGFEHGTPGPAHQAIAGKKMIVMASNIGHDVSSNQFDLMIPGGGLGLHTSGCATQWGIDTSDESLVGETYGGFASTCENQLGWNASLNDMKSCVRGMCDNLFGNDPSMQHLWEGCVWYVEWMQAANNPTFRYSETQCPQALRDLY